MDLKDIITLEPVGQFSILNLIILIILIIRVKKESSRMEKLTSLIFGGTSEKLK